MRLDVPTDVVALIISFISIARASAKSKAVNLAFFISSLNSSTSFGWPFNFFAFFFPLLDVLLSSSGASGTADDSSAILRYPRVYRKMASPQAAQKVQTVSCGRDIDCVVDLTQELQRSLNDKFDFLCVPLVHPRFERELVRSTNRCSPLTRSDLVLSSSEWTTVIVGKVSPWINLDSTLQTNRKNSEKAFFEEISFAVHLGLPAILVSLKSNDCVNLGRCLNTALMSRTLNQIWLKVPFADTEIVPSDRSSPVASGDATWNWWNTVRCLCSGKKKLGLVLDIPAVLPPEDDWQQWFGEPIKAAFLSTSVFSTNMKGFPVLPREHQLLLHQLFRLNVQLVLSGSNQTDKEMVTYVQYLNHLFTCRPSLGAVEEFAKGYEDYLQIPLQPLMDNLESQTYETFERDATKYIQYETAVFRALLDRVPEERRETTVTVIMVVGAGRGPLVKASLRASTRAGRRVKLYAIEKNPNAIITLRNLQWDEWADIDVTEVHTDMREWEAPEKADILVSELLGSFGDNELSPECLDGAQRFLKDDGISIPSSYTSYVAPTTACKLYCDINQCIEVGKLPQAPFETAYVVYQKSCRHLSQPKACFSFVHPNHQSPIDNERFASLSFEVGLDSILHGFTGYFESVLYKDVVLSILPSTHTEGMFSWFSLFFPLCSPMQVPSGSTVTINIWRRVNKVKVWYEWCVTKPLVSDIHNPSGRTYWLGLH